MTFIWASLVAQIVKNLPTMWETRVQPLGREDPLEKGRAAHSGILAWKIPWTEDPGRLQSMGSQRAGHDGATNTSYLCTFCKCHGPFCLLEPSAWKVKCFQLIWSGLMRTLPGNAATSFSKNHPHSICKLYTYLKLYTQLFFLFSARQICLFSD